MDKKHAGNAPQASAHKIEQFGSRSYLSDHHSKKNTEDEIIIHGRIGTAGEISARNTHPYIFNEELSPTQPITVRNDSLNRPVFMQNGGFGKYCKGIISKY